MLINSILTYYIICYTLISASTKAWPSWKAANSPSMSTSRKTLLMARSSSPRVSRSSQGLLSRGCGKALRAQRRALWPFSAPKRKMESATRKIHRARRCQAPKGTCTSQPLSSALAFGHRIACLESPLALNRACSACSACRGLFRLLLVDRVLRQQLPTSPPEPRPP